MVGADWLIERLRADGFAVAPMLARRRAAASTVENGVRQQSGPGRRVSRHRRPDGVLMLEDIRRRAKPVLRNGSASVWDIGDGVLCFEFTSKSNALDEQIMTLLGKTVALVKKDYKALVIYNEGANFSVGANIGLALFAANIAAWMQVESMVATGQDVMQKLKYAPFPVVAAPSGMALGGGCEFLLHADAVQAHAETYAGLVECGVGLLPGWGGCKEMLGRWATAPSCRTDRCRRRCQGVRDDQHGTGGQVRGAGRRDAGPAPTDRVTMNRYRLLADAKARALELAVDYKAPEPREIVLPGPSGKLVLDQAVAGFRKTGMATEARRGGLRRAGARADGRRHRHRRHGQGEQAARLERESFMRLLKTPGTLARIEHMLETGKPLRNSRSKKLRPLRAIQQDRDTSKVFLVLLQTRTASSLHRETRMQVYKAPLRDMRFVMHELHNSAAHVHRHRPAGRHRRADGQHPRGSGQVRHRHPAADQRQRRRGRLPPGKRRRAHAAGFCARPTRSSARPAGAHSPRPPNTAARACRKSSARWSRKCSARPTSPSASIPA